MPLDSYFAARIHALDGLQFSDIANPAVHDRLAEFFVDRLEWKVADGVDVTDIVVPSGPVDIPVRLYRPPTPPAAVLVWLHGGGFASGDLDMPEAHVVAAEIAHRGSVLVASVGYRLARNGVTYPAPVDDAVAAWRRVTGSLARGIPAALGGASAGAAIAIAAALRIEAETGRKADKLLLAYPFVHFPTPALDWATAAEMRHFPELLRNSPESIAGMVEGYVGRLSRIPAEALPGAADLRGLPATTILLSEYDDLRPSGELLARQLIESGVTVSSSVARGMLHGHLNRLPSHVEVDRSLDFFVTAITSS